MGHLRFLLTWAFSVLVPTAFGNSPKFSCNSGSFNISLIGDIDGFLNIDCGSPLVAEVSLAAKAEESCEDVQSLRIMSRKEWQGSEDRVEQEVRTYPADYVMVNILPHPYPAGGDYTRKLINLQNEHNIYQGSLLYNFIIGDDGTVYEALGWDKFNFINSGGLNSLRIRFMTQTNILAPPPAVQAFKTLIKAAQCRGSLSPNYKLIPQSNIRDYGNYKLEHDLLKTLDNLEENKDFYEVCSISPPIPITFREEWKNRLPENLLKHTSPIDVVVVRNYEARCLTLKVCHGMMEFYASKGKLQDVNFFVAEDGQTYEYLGWEYTKKEWLKDRNAIVVALLGTYYHYPPSKRAFTSLDKFLRYGLTWGYLSKNYIIVSYRHVDSHDSFLGAGLHNELQKLDRFTDRI